MSYMGCIKALSSAAGRSLTDDEVRAIYERVHKAALDIKAGRVDPAEVTLGQKLGQQTGLGLSQDGLIQAAAERAAKDLIAEAELRERQANLQVFALSKRMRDFETNKAVGLSPLEAVERTIVRDYTGKTNIESLEQRVSGYQSYLGAKLSQTWNALGNDWFGFFQDKNKLVTLVKELRGENTGDSVAAKGAKAFHDVAEEARKAFNNAGGEVGRLDDWGMPQHHSQEKVAVAGKQTWVDNILPMLDRARYVDDLGTPYTDAELKQFLGKAWDSIATDGIANLEPGTFKGTGKRANRHAESRQIHFKDADSVIKYWEQFGDRTVVEILNGHIERMAKDIAFIEHFGPNPDVTYRTMRDEALKQAVVADPNKLETLKGQAVKLDQLYDYSSGKMKPSANLTISRVADGIASLNAAGKLGGAAIASFFGDKPMMEAVSHLNDLPMFQRWTTELSLLNPANDADRALLQRQGLMLDSVRSGLGRFYEGLGSSGLTGKFSNAVMRITGMNAINDIRKGAFGLSLMDAIGSEIKKGVDFNSLPDSDIRTMRNYGITEADWKIWKLAPLDQVGVNKNVLTPESIGRISDADIKAAGFSDPAQAKRESIVKLLGAVNTESEFAIVTPGWKERAQFYSDLQRGTVKGEIARSVLQFKSFPWAMLQRGMDTVANSDGPTGKAAMVAYLVASTTIAGAMLMQTRDMISGKDPKSMVNDDAYKFWLQAFLSGGALGIYGDFLYGANQTKYGSGILETMAGPTLGPLLEIGLVQPMAAAKKQIEGKESFLAAQTIQDLKGFIPGNNVWYTKAATDHMIWQNIMESLSPGYLANMRTRTLRDYNQDWWYEPGEITPSRAPDFGKALEN